MPDYEFHIVVDEARRQKTLTTARHDAVAQNRNAALRQAGVLRSILRQQEMLNSIRTQENLLRLAQLREDTLRQVQREKALASGLQDIVIANRDAALRHAGTLASILGPDEALGSARLRQDMLRLTTVSDYGSRFEIFRLAGLQEWSDPPHVPSTDFTEHVARFERNPLKDLEDRIDELEKEVEQLRKDQGAEAPKTDPGGDKTYGNYL